MKRAERQRLKQNDLGELTRQAQEAFTSRKRDLGWIAAAVVVVGAAALGYWAWNQRVQQGAQKLLADAMVVQEARIGPPAAATGGTGLTFPTERERAQAAFTKFKAAADAYPTTDAGLFARYQEASTQVVLGNPGEAAKAYQIVIDRAGNRLIGQTARLGLAAAHARGGQFDQAITTYKELAQRKDGGLPVDGILMELGRVYREAGRANDAQQTFNRLIEEFPDSPFNADAKRELEALKKTKAA
jgi:tetratricopeptide (TPR) repeat protein